MEIFPAANINNSIFFVSNSANSVWNFESQNETKDHNYDKRMPIFQLPIYSTTISKKHPTPMISQIRFKHEIYMLNSA